MKRLILSVAIASALGLAGCGGDSQSDYINDETGKNPPVEASRIQWDPANGVVSLPNDLLFNGTLDGTLEIPGEEGGDYTDPQVALGGLDGWSTTMPITVNIDVPEGAAELDPTSAMQPGAVRLFEVALGGALSTDPECTAEGTLTMCKVGDELVYGEDYVVSANGTSVSIVPLKPLKPKTGYSYITTQMLTDTDGEAVLGSLSFDSLLLDLKGFTPDQLFLKTLLEDYIGDLSAAHGVDADMVTYAGVFTTQSVTDAVSTLTQLMADGLQPMPQNAVSPLFAPMWTAPPMPAGATVAEALGLTPSMEPSYLLADATDIYVAELELPYYLTIPTPTNPDVDSRWMALGDSPLSVLQKVLDGSFLQEDFAAQAIAQGIDPTMVLTDPSLLVGASFTIDGEPVDPVRHVTRLNPVPNPCGGVPMPACMGSQQRVTVPVQITMPNETKLAALGMEITKPASGWPLAMSMHGLGGTKETNLPLAGSYSAGGIATVSIDMPLHGARGFDLSGNGVYDISATDPGFGAQYANGNALVFSKLDSSLTNRDNFRQAIVDHLALRLAMTAYTVAEVTAQLGAGAAVPMPTFDMAKVSLEGLSLGAITGTSVTAYANSWPEAFGDNPYALTNASLVAPAGGLAGVFAGSATFGPILRATLVAELAPDCIDPATGGVLDAPACDAVLAQIETDVIPPFAFAAQTAIDSMDPVNHAAMLAATGTPVHLIEIVGDDMQPGDLVLPNTVAGFPLSGTEPLIAAIGLDGVTESTMAADGVSGAVRFSKGHHSSVASPFVPAALDGALSPEDAAAATVEMQTQIVSHAASQGAALQVTNGCVISGGTCE